MPDLAMPVPTVEPGSAWRFEDTWDTREGADVYYRNRVEAYMRAERLLVEHLNTSQLENYLVCRAFGAAGSASKNTYVIDARGVFRQRDGHSFCLQVGGVHLPVPDAMLAKKLIIENDEPRFLATANDLTGGMGVVEQSFGIGAPPQAPQRYPGERVAQETRLIQQYREQFQAERRSLSDTFARALFRRDDE